MDVEGENGDHTFICRGNVDARVELVRLEPDFHEVRVDVVPPVHGIVWQTVETVEQFHHLWSPARSLKTWGLYEVRCLVNNRGEERRLHV